MIGTNNNNNPLLIVRDHSYILGCLLTSSPASASVVGTNFNLQVSVRVLGYLHAFSYLGASHRRRIEGSPRCVSTGHSLSHSWRRRLIINLCNRGVLYSGLY